MTAHALNGCASYGVRSVSIEERTLQRRTANDVIKVKRLVDLGERYLHLYHRGKERRQTRAYISNSLMYSPHKRTAALLLAMRFRLRNAKRNGERFYA